MRHTRLLKLVAIATPLFTSNTNARLMPLRDLFERSSSCLVSGDVYCAGTHLPSNFCCPSTSTCLTLASNTTLLCCPEGETCSVVATIPCNIQNLNATANPSSQLHTTELSGTLPTCGSSCCPFGYSCSSDETCVINANQNPSSTASISSTAASKSATSTPTILPDPSNTATTAAASSAQPSSVTTKPSTDNEFPVKAVLAGLFPGIVAGILIAVSVFCCLGARRRSKATKTQVSNPIYQPGSSLRTDFLRRQAPTPTSTVGNLKRATTIEHVKSLFHKSNASSDTLSSFASNNPMTSIPRAAPVPPGGPLEPHPNPRIFVSGAGASPAMRQRESGTEEINVGFRGTGLGVQGVDGLHRGSHQTTFSDMMERANFKKGEPFVPGHRAN